MQAALRLARHHRAHPLRAIRCLATTANPPTNTTAHTVGSTSTSTSTTTSTTAGTGKPPLAPIPISNVEAQWANMSAEEKLSVQEQLEEIQKKDWKTLSIDEKKAAYYVAFGPHGPRTPVSQPGDGFKIFFWTMALITLGGGGLFFTARAFGQPPPKTLTKEWEEATNERALEMKLNPITGISSEGYSGKGFVQTK